MAIIDKLIRNLFLIDRFSNKTCRQRVPSCSNQKYINNVAVKNFPKTLGLLCFVVVVSSVRQGTYNIRIL